MANNTTRFKHRSLLERILNYFKILRIKNSGVILGANTYVMGGVPHI